ncbi:TPA: hypothetical protein ACI0KP_001295 [Streptococcus agalactiae]
MKSHKTVVYFGEVEITSKAFGSYVEAENENTAFNGSTQVLCMK